MKRALAFTLMVLAIMIIAVSCEEPQAQVHEHTYAEEWSHDDTFHWHASACGHEEEVSDKEAHKWKEGGDEDGWIVDVESTEKEVGKKHRECSVCGYKEEGTVPLKGHVHTFSAYDHTADKHWRTCTGCGEKFTYTHTFSYASVNGTNHCQKCYCGYSKNTEVHSYNDGKQKVDGTTVYNICDKCGYQDPVKKAETNTEVATAANTTTVNATDYTTKSVTIKNEKGTEETKTLTINDKPVSIPVTSSAVSSTVAEGASTEEKKKATTTVEFPAGALKVEEGASSVSLVVAAAPAAVASNASYQVTTSSSGSEKVEGEGAVVAGFEFKLEGAVASDLFASNSTDDAPKGTTVTTYIATGLAQSVADKADATTGDIAKDDLGALITIKYIGSNKGQGPEIVSYNNKNGKLVFTVYHFSKYAVISNVAVATDNLGNMYFDSNSEESVARSGLDLALAKLASNDANDEKITRITLLKDSKLTESVKIKKSGTLDLNGKQVSIETEKEISVDSEKCLTIEKSSKAMEALIEAVVRIDGKENIDGRYYNTVKEAINEAVSETSNNETVTLLADAEITDLSTPINIDRNLTINLNSKTLTVKNAKEVATRDDATAFNILKNSKVIVKSGNIKGWNGTTFCLKEDGADLKLDDVNATLDNEIAKAPTYWKAKNGEWITPKVVQIYQCVEPILTVSNSTLTVEHGSYGIATNATVGADNKVAKMTVNISKTTVETKSNDSTALLLNVPGTVTITDSSAFIGDRQGAILRGGDYTISDSKFEYKTNNKENLEYENNGWKDGNAVPNAAIVIGNNSSSYAYSTKVKLSGNITLTVPTSTDQLKSCHLYIYQADAGTNESENLRKVTVTGNVDTTWKTNEDFNGATVKSEDGKTWYIAGAESFKAAIENAAEKSTIEMLTDVTLNDSIKIEKSILLDLNGRTITYKPSSGNTNRLFDIEEGATFTVKDTSTNKKGKVENVEETSLGLFDVSGALVIENGQFETVGSTKKNNDSRGAIIFGTSTGSITIKEGTYNAKAFDAAIYSKGQLVIDGGTFTSNSYYEESGSNSGKYQYAVTVNGGEGTINGGKVNGIHGAIAVVAGKCTISDVDASTFNKKDGEELTHPSFHALYIAGEVDTIEAVVNGGKFTSVVGQAAYIGNETKGDGGNMEKVSVTFEGGEFTATSNSNNDITYSTKTTSGKDGFFVIKGGAYKNKNIGVQNGSAVALSTLIAGGYKVVEENGMNCVKAETT